MNPMSYDLNGCNYTGAVTKCPSIDEWVRKMQCLYTIEYYPAIRKKKS